MISKITQLVTTYQDQQLIDELYQLFLEERTRVARVGYIIGRNRMREEKEGKKEFHFRTLEDFIKEVEGKEFPKEIVSNNGEIIFERKEDGLYYKAPWNSPLGAGLPQHAFNMNFFKAKF